MGSWTLTCKNSSLACVANSPSALSERLISSPLVELDATDFCLPELHPIAGPSLQKNLMVLVWDLRSRMCTPKAQSIISNGPIDVALYSIPRLLVPRRYPNRCCTSAQSINLGSACSVCRYDTAAAMSDLVRSIHAIDSQVLTCSSRQWLRLVCG